MQDEASLPSRHGYLLLVVIDRLEGGGSRITVEFGFIIVT